jgi:Secretion system C-terminal sorting domain
MTFFNFKQKILIGFSALVFSFNAVSAQVAPSFKVTPDTSAITSNPDPNEIESIADSYITNLSASDVTIRWRRNFLSGGQGTQVKVCDINACYGVNVITKEFVLAGNTEGLLSVHLVHNAATNLSGFVRLDLWDINQLPTPDTLRSYYLFNDATTFTTNFSRESNIEVYPNPAQDWVTLSNAAQIATVRIFNVDGREVETVNVAQQAAFSVGHLPVGNYVLMLADKNGKISDVKELSKR